MDKNNRFSSFGKWVSPIFTKMFMNQLAAANQERYTKKLTTPPYLKLFIHAQLQQREGLRAIADDVCSETFQNELGFTSISSSQLCRKNSQVDSDLL